VGSPLSSESRDLLKLLLDGQWQPLDDVKARAANRVMPGRALRHYQTKEQSRLSREGPRTHQELDVDQQIRSGQVALVNQAVYSMTKKYLEVRDDGLLGRRMVRIRPKMLEQIKARPTTLSPGKAEDPPTTPEEEESMPEPQPTAPLESSTGVTEERLRSIFAEEISAALDTFQLGMQRYLDAQFADLDRRRRRGNRGGDSRLPLDIRRR